MKKWQPLAAPDDPDSFYDIDAFWPTSRGSYETADILSSSALTATATPSATAPVYAFTTIDLSDAYYEFVAAGVGGVWRATPFGAPPTGLVNVTGTASVASPVNASMASFGNIVLYATANGLFKIANTDSAFSTPSQPPIASPSLICVQSNAVVVARDTSTGDAWATSDVGDYTNWSTGEAANGRIYHKPGKIMALVPFGNDVIVFKKNSIYRMTYVGGLIKWTVALVWTGNGCGAVRGAQAGNRGILYCGVTQSDTGNPSTPWYYFDGSNAPSLVNPFNNIPASSSIIYNPLRDIFTVWSAGVAYYFSPTDMAWGRNTVATGDASFIPLEGDFAAHFELTSTTSGYGTGASGTQFKRWATAGGATGTAGACYVQTSMSGKPDRKSTALQVIPLLRRKTDLGSATVSCAVNAWRERSDVTAQSSVNAPVSAYRDRFDVNGQSGVTDNFIRAKVTWTNCDVELDDVIVKTKDAGAN